MKTFLTKIPLFLFCVFFISTHNRFFGAENSIVGVILIMSLLILLTSDFGFAPKQVAFTIPLLFFIMVLGPKLSLLHPVLGLVVNFCSIFILLALSSYHITLGNYVVFMMGYIMFQGYDVAGVLFEKRMISVMGFSVVLGILYFLLHYKKEYTLTLKDVITSTNLHSVRTQWYLKLTTTLTLVMFFGDVLHFPRSMWINLAVLSLLTPRPEDYKVRGKYRLPATVLGTCCFFVITQILVPEQYHTIVVMIAGFTSMFLSDYFIKTIFNSFCALMTSMVLFPAKEAVIIRIVANILGVLIAVCSQYLADHAFKKYPIAEIECVSPEKGIVFFYFIRRFSSKRGADFKIHTS